MSLRRAGVIVVGAGFTGLCAALALRDAGVDVVVLEARDGVGGRVESTLNSLGERIDTGGQFLCDDMPELMALARRHGKTLVEASVDGAVTVRPPMSDAEAERTYFASMALRDRMNAIDPDDPAIAGQSVADWLLRQDATAAAKGAFRSMIEGLWCQPLELVPLWYLVSNDRRVTNAVSELQYFPRDTMHDLAEAVAATLGSSIHLSSPVTGIRHGPDGVEVVAGGVTWQARCVIVAVPPVAAAAIPFQPVLPTTLARALSVWRSGTVIKALVRFSRPFWRDAGRNGMVMWRDVHGLFACDASRADEQAALVVFVGGPLAEAWRAAGADGVRAAIGEHLVDALGAAAGAPLAVTLRDWTGDRWSGGGYSDVIVDATATDAEDVLRAGAWPLVFACSELSPSYPGYIEGAIVAGRQAAARCLDGLGVDGR